MVLNLFLQGIIEIILSFISGLFIFFISFNVFSLITKDIDELKEIKENNISVAILGVSFVFGIMLIVKSAISPAMDTLTELLQAKEFIIGQTVFAFIRIVVFYVVSALFAFLILWLSIKVFLILTIDIDEMDEIKNKNISVSIIISTLVVSMSILLINPLITLLNGLVAPPAIADSAIKEHLINMNIFLQGLIELGLSIIGVLFVFFVSFKIFQVLTRNIDEMAEIKKNNIAVGILNASFVFSIMLVIKAALIPANQDLDRALNNENAEIILILFSVLRIIGFFILSAIIAFILIWLSLKCFMMLTRGIDEMSEIKNNNVAVAILIAILSISSAFLLQHGITVLLQGMIPLPQLNSGVIDISNIR
jgi:uncharacterized membrane protein YjfL (UPF0719 family)